MNPINRLHTYAIFFQDPTNEYHQRIMNLSQVQLIIKNSELTTDIPSNLANQFINIRPWFLREALSLCLTPTSITRKAYMGFTHLINTFMDKGVLIKKSMFNKNEFEKWSCLLRDHLLMNEEYFNTMDNDEKKNYMMIWEVYADLHPEDERILEINP